MADKLVEYAVAAKEIARNENEYRTLASSGSPWVSGGFDEMILVRTIDRRILPLLCMTYFLQFMDKIILNYANVMGIQEDLGMKNNDFSWAGTAFFLGYIAAELPQGTLLQRYPVTKVMSINVCLWGIVTASTAAAQNSRDLLALRTLLGVFEAVVTPSLLMITAAWYKRQEGAYRFGIWFCGLGVGQILGGLISFGAQHSKSNFQGWRLMFLIIGVINIFLSGFIYRLPSCPEEATFLSATEKEFTLRRLKDDHAGTGVKVLRLRSVYEALLDFQTWFLCLITILTTMSAGVVVYYSSILIKGFGYDAKEAALLNMPSGLVSIVTTLGVAYVVKNGYQRSIAIAIVCVPATLGACLMSFLPKTQKAGLLIGIYLVNTAPSVYALVLSTAGANYRGYTRKIAGSAIIAVAFSVANILSPQTFQARDAPEYLPAKITLVVVMASSIVVALCLRILYGSRNSRAEKLDEPAMSRFERNAISVRNDSVDFADRSYRYSY